MHVLGFLSLSKKRNLLKACNNRQKQTQKIFKIGIDFFKT